MHDCRMGNKERYNEVDFFAGRKVPLLPPSTPPVRPHARTVSRSHEPESCEYYDSFDLLLRNPDLKVEPKTSEIDVRGPIPTPRSEELKKRLTTTSAGLLHSPM